MSTTSLELSGIEIANLIAALTYFQAEDDGSDIRPADCLRGRPLDAWESSQLRDTLARAERNLWAKIARSNHPRGHARKVVPASIRETTNA